MGNLLGTPAVFLALAILFAIIWIAAPSFAAAAPEKTVRATIIYRDAADYAKATAGGKKSAPEDISAKALRAGGKIRHKFAAINAVSAEFTESELSEIERDPRIIVERSKPVRAFLQESVPLIRANDTWARAVGGQNITGAGTSVCVIDTGVDYNHTDLGGGWGNKMIAGYNAITGQDCSSNNAACFDDNGHGTHVSGIVAANGSIKGVAPDAKIVAVKALDSSGSGYLQDTEAGIDWCISNATKYNIAAISMSLGTPEQYASFCDSNPNYTSTKALIDAAVAKNISVVVATGNDGNYTAISSPACIQNATRVTATDKSDSYAGFANRAASFPDILAALGVDINSTRSDSLCHLGFTCSGNYMIGSGTSMSAPHVSGAIALLSQAYKTKHGGFPAPSFLWSALNLTGERIHDSQTGLDFSRINVLAALDSFTAVKIISSYNNITGNMSGDIAINETYSVFFNVSADQEASYFWYLNSTLQNSAQNNFSWHTGYNDSGTWAVIAVVSNGYFNTSFQWNVTVLNVNRPPYIFPPLNSAIIMQRQNQAPYNISANVHDDDGDNISVTVNDGNITVAGLTLFFNYLELVVNKSVTVTINDSLAAANQTISISVIDTLAPKIIISSPENKTYNISALLLNFSLDEHADWCGYSLNDTANATLISCANATFNAAGGQDNITLYVNDTAGNMNRSTVYFSVDTTAPEINITALNYTADDFVFVNATISESPDSCILYFGANAYAMSASGTSCTHNVTSLNPATYNFSVFANDSAGNMNRTGNFSVQVFYCFESYGGWSGCTSGKRERSHTLRDCSVLPEQESCQSQSGGGGGYTGGITQKNNTNNTFLNVRQATLNGTGNTKENVLHLNISGENDGTGAGKIQEKTAPIGESPKEVSGRIDGRITAAISGIFRETMARIFSGSVIDAGRASGRSSSILDSISSSITVAGKIASGAVRTLFGWIFKPFV